ncbi:MAG: hypothetical protein OHK0039_29070 [Bacteroidia bacterium]
MWKHTRTSLCFLALLLAASAPLGAQRVLGEHKIRKFPTEDNDVYPYDYLRQPGTTLFALHDPCVQVGEGEYVHIWQPDRGFARERMMRKYDIFAEERWAIELELEREEEILHCYAVDTAVVLITTRFDFDKDQHLVYARTYDLETGEAAEPRILYLVNGKSDQEVLLALAPGGQHFLLYHFKSESPVQRVGLQYDRVMGDDQPGYRVVSARHVYFSFFDLSLELLDTGVLDLPTRHCVVQDCRPDSAGNVYVVVHERRQRLHVFQHRRADHSQQHLVHEDYVRAGELYDPYLTHQPPLAARGGRLYITQPTIRKQGRGRGLQRLDVLCFDFGAGRVDRSREVVINSTLLVAVQKQRALFGMRTLRHFDNYVVRGLVEMQDSSLWLITQRYEAFNHTYTPYSADRREFYEQRIEELVLYEFDPAGSLRQVITVPMTQKLSTYYDRTALFYAMDIDPVRKQLRLLTREPSGDKLTGPERIYHRRIDLATPRVSARTLVYESRRRNTYLLNAYTEWLNPDIVSFVAVDTPGGSAYTVVVNVEAEPQPDDDSR